MTPTIDERLASVIRALTDVVAPSLPADAGLAQEQVQMCIGHLGILRGQVDAAPAYEAREVAEVRALGAALLREGAIREAGSAAAETLSSMLEEPVGDGEDARSLLSRLEGAISAVIVEVGGQSDADARALMQEIVVGHERDRVQHDRKWCAPFGFDSTVAA